MKDKEIEKLSELLRKEKVTHLLLVRMRNGIALSSIAKGDDIYDFLQILAEQDPVVLDIMQAVINSKKHPPRKMDVN